MNDHTRSRSHSAVPPWPLLALALLTAAGCSGDWTWDWAYVPGRAASSPTGAPRGGHQLVEDGQYYRERGLNDAALASFALAVAEDPRQVPAHIGMGDIYRERGQYDRARHSYEQATALEPANYHAQYHLALVYHHLGMVSRAVRGYLIALTLEPDSYGANRHLAAAYLQLGRTAEALPYARRATELDERSHAAWAQYAEALRVLGRYEEADAAYRRAAELGTPDPAIVLGHVRAMIELEQFDEAQRMLQRLLDNRSTLDARERMAFLKFRSGRYQRALHHYGQVVDEAEALPEPQRLAEPAYIRAINGRGVSLMAMYIQDGRREDRLRQQALEAWRKSLRLNPDQPRIKDLIARYQRRGG